MDTPTLKKFLKFVCIACMVVYAAFVVVGALIAASVIPPEAYSEALGLTELLQGPQAALYATISGVLIAISYAIRFLFTVPVFRAIKNPSKMKLGLVLYGILCVLTLVNIVMSFQKGGDLTTAYTQLFADVCIFGAAFELYRTSK